MIMKKQPTIDITQDPGLIGVPTYVKPKPPINIPKYHWVPDKVDKRDYLYRPTTNTQPDVVDLRNFCSSIENQGQLGSCTGNAIAGAIEYLDKKNNRPIDVSRLYIYYFERLLEGTVNYDSGAYIRDGIKATYYYGAPSETLWPYDISKFRTMPSKAALDDGQKRKVTLYERVSDLNGCLTALANQFPIIIGFKVYSSFESRETTLTGIMHYPNTRTEQLLGGHAVLLVGYDKRRQVFIARNSWGPYWGDHGYFYMPFSVINDPNMSSDFWVIKNVSNP